MHNKCMGLYGNLSKTSNARQTKFVRGENWTKFVYLVTDLCHKSFNRINLQYRSEISGLRAGKTQAQFLRKHVLKNVCLSVLKNAFARI